MGISGAGLGVGGGQRCKDPAAGGGGEEQNVPKVSGSVARLAQVMKSGFYTRVLHVSSDMSTAALNATAGISLEDSA